MSAPALTALVTTDARGVLVRAPKIGIWSARPAIGAPVAAGSTVGMLTTAGRRFALVLPEGVSGRVAGEPSSLRATPVTYGDVLFHLTPLGDAASGRAVGPSSRSTGEDFALTVNAPTEGVFYRSPAAGAKPFVAVGERVKAGRPVGLIEVMKTFNPIPYGGGGLPEEGEIVAVLASDGQEVRAGQALLAVKPL